MTNEEKLKRIEELESQILFSQKEISDIKDSMKYEEDFTGRYYQKKHSAMFAKVLYDHSNGCLILQFELHENLYDGDEIPDNNEFSLNVYLSWISKNILEAQYVQVNEYKSNVFEDMQKIYHYILEHFG